MQQHSEGIQGGERMMRRRWKGHASEAHPSDPLAYLRQKNHQLANENAQLKAELAKVHHHYDKQNEKLRELESGLVTAREAELLKRIALLEKTADRGAADGA
jgi:predicted nuclease with TOPRIM domain